MARFKEAWSAMLVFIGPVAGQGGKTLGRITLSLKRDPSREITADLTTEEIHEWRERLAELLISLGDKPREVTSDPQKVRKQVAEELWRAMHVEPRILKPGLYKAAITIDPDLAWREVD